MRVDIIVNAKAGKVRKDIVESNVRKALFRCQLHFHYPLDVPSLHSNIKEALDAKTEFLVVCGGDGSLNQTLSPLITARTGGAAVPPVCIIPLGTANDLAHEFGISSKIDQAARAVLEGGVTFVDVIEIEARGKKAYMLTNGGLGIPAQTAEKSNIIREKLKAWTTEVPPMIRPFARLAYKTVQAAGSKIYEVLLLKEITTWKTGPWEVEVAVPGKTAFKTRAPFIMVNNQPTVGRKFTPAPHTSNRDGTFNVLLIDSNGLMEEVKAVLDIRMGRTPNGNVCPSFETSELRIRSMNSNRPLTFFGDGEILHKDVAEVSIRCLHPGLAIATANEPK